MRVCASIGEGACDVRLGLTMAAMNKIQPVELLERNRIAVGEGMVLGYRQDIFPVPTEGAGQGFVGSVPVSPRCIHK